MFLALLRDFVGDGKSDVDQARRIMDSVLQTVTVMCSGVQMKAVCFSNNMKTLKSKIQKPLLFETDASAQGALQN